MTNCVSAPLRIHVKSYLDKDLYKKSLTVNASSVGYYTVQCPHVVSHFPGMTKWLAIEGIWSSFLPVFWGENVPFVCRLLSYFQELELDIKIYCVMNLFRRYGLFQKSD